MAKAIDSQDSATDKVGKLLPSEVTGLYLSVRALFAGTDADPTSGYILILMAILCLVAAVGYIINVRGVTNRKHIVIYIVTFVIWALTLDSDRVGSMVAAVLPAAYFGRIIASISILWTFVISWVPSATVSSMDSATAKPVAPLAQSSAA